MRQRHSLPPLCMNRLNVAKSTHIVIACVVSFSFLAVLGCKPEPKAVSQADELPLPQGTESSSAPSTNTLPQQSSSDTALARRLLERVIANYRSTAAYSDRGRVRLRYLQNGKEHIDEAPLSVVFERGNQLFLKAYGTELLIHQGRLTATINDPPTNNIGGQMLDVPLSVSPFGLKEIYSEPTLTHFTSIGMGGPSPQLELLLSDEPLAGLFQGTAQVSLAAPQPIGDYPCDRLTIQSGDLTYVLWIDRDDLLVRRVELPTSGTELAADTSVSNIQLSIEIEGASMKVASDVSWKLSSPKPELSVRHFVLPPPPLVSADLGRKLPPFELVDSRGEIRISQQGSDRDITVLLWIADHPASRAAASQMQVIADARAAANLKNVRFLLVMSEPTPPPSSATADMLRTWNVGLPYCDDYQAIGRDVFKISEAPTLCVLATDGTLQWFAPRVGPEITADLPAILTDLGKGVRMGEEIARRYAKDQDTYRRLLQEAMPQPIE